MVVSTEDMQAIGTGVVIGTLLPLGLKQFADPVETGLTAESLRLFKKPSSYVSLATGIPMLLLGAAGFMGKGPVTNPIYQEAMIGYGIPATLLGSMIAAETHEEAKVLPEPEAVKREVGAELLGISPEERAFVAAYP